MDLHEYEDVAENYDLYIPALNVGGGGLVEFHLGLAREYGGGGILDIACGTGATLLPLIEHGWRVTGVDLSAAMLAVLERKLAGLPQQVRARARLIHADMKTFESGERASLAIIPRSGFMHLLTTADQEAALTNIRRQLAPGGILSFNTFDPNYTMIAAGLKGKPAERVLRTEFTNRAGRRERIWNQAEYDPATQVIEVRWTFEELDENGAATGTREHLLHLRWSFEFETRLLLRLCGFEPLEIYSSYEKAPRVYGTPLVWVARKTGD